MFRISFKDYLNVYHKKKDSLYFYTQILRLKKRGFSVRDIRMLFKGKVKDATIYNWLNEKHIPFEFKGFLNSKKYFTEKDIANLAYIMGSILGDGGIVTKGRVHYCNTEIFLILRFKEAINKVFPNEKPSETKDGNAMHLIYSPRIGRVLWCLFGKFSYGKDTKNITSQINNQPLAWKIEAVQALYNDEGSVIMTKHNTKYISFKQKSTSVTDFVCLVLTECGIRYIRANDEGKWMVRICGYNNLLLFKQKIGFSAGYRKAEKLDLLLDSIHHPHFVTKQKIIDILKDGSKTYIEIAQRFNLHPKTIRSHIHGWNKESQKESLLKLGLVKATKQGRKQMYSLA